MLQIKQLKTNFFMGKVFSILVEVYANTKFKHEGEFFLDSNRNYEK